MSIKTDIIWQAIAGSRHFACRSYRLCSDLPTCYALHMGMIQDAFEGEIAKLPRLAAKQIVEEKLKATGLVDAMLTAKIVQCIFDADGPDSIEWEGDGPAIDLSFTDTDMERINQIETRYVEAMPGMLKQVVENAGADFVGEFRRQWQERRQGYRTEFDSFKTRLAERWGGPMEDLRLLLELCRDIGIGFDESLERSKLKRNRVRNETLGRLHVRSCQVAAEMLVLLENGYSEGARARWRTLLEIEVIATLIAEGGDALAERYLAHDAVDQKKAMEDYQRSAPLLNEPPVSAREIAAADKRLAAALRKYGKSFKGSYGWAGGQLGLKDEPNFFDLLEVAGNLSMKVYYRLACFGVHGSPRALTQQLHRFDPGSQTAGASNVGLKEPGANFAHTLVQITSLLMGDPWDLDKLAHIQSLLYLRDEITVGLYKTAARLEQDELKARRQIIKLAERSLVHGRRKRSR